MNTEIIDQLRSGFATMHIYSSGEVVRNQQVEFQFRGSGEL